MSAAGNKPGDLGTYQVTNLDANTTLEMDPVSYGLWAEFDGMTTIDAACQGVVRVFPAINDKQVVLKRVPAFLIALIAARYIFIDHQVDREAFA